MADPYKNPPIEEALIEFRFSPGDEWDLTIPGKLHGHPAIKDNYPGKPRTQKVVEAALHASPDQPPNFAVREGVGRIQLVDEAEKHLLSLGADVLGVHSLKPYEGWDTFRPRIEAALRAYGDVAEPTGVSRVGVRYINKIILPGHDLEPATYFRCGPPAAPELPSKMGGFVSRVECLYDDGIKLLLTQASIGAPEGQSGFLLDLDLIWEGTKVRALEGIMTLVDDLHDREGAAFEAVITDATRETFNAD